MKSWQQQSWNPQYTISLDKGYVFIDDIVVQTERENALANIIMRLNAQVIYTQVLLKELQVKYPENKGGVYRDGGGI